MPKSTGLVIPFRPPATSRRIDLAMALARLSKGVEAHERALQRARLLFLRRLCIRPLGPCRHAKSLGA
jgi:hypothetical protein